MRPETRVKARRAFEIAGELYRLLDELSRELSNREDFAGYLLVRNIHDHVYGRNSSGVDVLSSLIAVSQMGEPSSGEPLCAVSDQTSKNSSPASKRGVNKKQSKTSRQR